MRNRNMFAPIMAMAGLLGMTNAPSMGPIVLSPPIEPHVPSRGAGKRYPKPYYKMITRPRKNRRVDGRFKRTNQFRNKFNLWNPDQLGS